ncbi:MAG: SpoIIE family protein phosphatase, partial [Firmicutes bacterium]|nr:SpoIIE family protein phosphatase [Candidatus Caballimonas caccae]
MNKKTNFSKIKYFWKQIIYGVCFGALAIVGSHWGIPFANNTSANARDAAVLTSGLLFGAPSGIIAGLIGGVERFVSVYYKHFALGSYTQIACSVSTALAGLYAAGLRKFMFEDKKPGWLIALAIGVVMEVFHLTMVFITNMSDTTRAMAVVKSCTVPMVTANGLSVMFASMALSIIGKEKIEKKLSKVHISQTIQRWLLFAVVIAFGLTSYFVYSMQDELAIAQAQATLDSSIDEISLDIEDATIQEIVDNPEEYIKQAVKNRNVGTDGYVIVLDVDELAKGNNPVVFIPSRVVDEEIEKAFSNREAELIEYIGNQNMFEVTIKNVDLSKEEGKEDKQDVDYFGKITLVAEKYCIISLLPRAEAMQIRNVAVYVNTFMEIMVFAILFYLIYMLIKKVVVNQIKSINNSLSKITGGDLGVVVNVRTSEEFASLSDDINSTVDTLKNYIAEASSRIDKELEFAKNIQASALPNVFPAFPKRKDFDIYASMDPAKEVGGDFYDFYMTEGDTLNFLIADVSGKGIPAAMFMMRAKTELKTLTEAGTAIDNVFTIGNRELCEGNDAGMFVTAWQGGVDLTTGLVKFANAGHNAPLVKKANGKFEYLKGRAGFVLAGMDGVKYKEQQIQLERGDEIFLYTDGVTEAQNIKGELFGEERLLKAINSTKTTDMKKLCEYVKKKVEAYVGEAPQFDDITMVAFKYVGTEPAPSISFEKATLNDIPKVTEFIEGELEKINCPMKIVTQMNIAIDEIFSNIVRYGYPKEAGPVTVSIRIKEEPKTINIRFVDEGVPYNPLTKSDPDVTLSAEERNIGGLGIFMVKKTMDDLKYK